MPLAVDSREMTTKTEFEKAIEAATGESVESLRDTPIDERRSKIGKKWGRLHVLTFFPFIGRGNIMRDHIRSREEVDADLDKALR